MIEITEDDGLIRVCSQCRDNIATDEDLCEECWEKVVSHLVLNERRDIRG